MALKGKTNESQSQKGNQEKSTATTAREETWAAETALIPWDIRDSSHEDPNEAQRSRLGDARIPGPQRQALAQRINGLQGNSHLQRVVNQIQRTNGEEAHEEEPIETSGLGVRGKTPGHGNLGAATLLTAPTIQRQNGGSGSVTANITFTVNAATIIEKPAADIASAHGRAGVAGWTTPRYAVGVPFANTGQIDITVTLDFDMELATEYTGDRRTILQDHENGHVNIGRDEAQEHFVDGLEAALESQSALSRASIQTAIQNAETQFVAQEAAESQSYDTSDYPRMTQAYHGARTPLADLESASGNISRMARYLRSFNGAVMLALQGQVRLLAQYVIDAIGALSTDELSQLQYNPEFKGLVSTAGSKIDEYIESQEYNLLITEVSMLSDRTRQTLETMRTALSGFTWVSPV